VSSIFILLLALLLSGCGRGSEIKIISPGETSLPKEVASLPQEKEKEKIETKTISEVPLENPFLKLEERESDRLKNQRKTIDYLNLTAIFHSPPTSRAIVEGKIVKEGDIIDNKRVIEIQPEAIVLKDFEGEYILELRDVISPKKSETQGSELIGKISEEQKVQGSSETPKQK